MRSSRVGAAALCFAAFWIGASCGPRAPGTDDAPGVAAGGASVAGDEAPEASAREAQAPRDSTREPGALHEVEAAPVRGWTGPGGHAFSVTLRTIEPATPNVRRFGTTMLRNSLRVRAPDLGQYPCTSCHLGRRMRLADERIGDAHQNITAVHPEQTGGSCSTCHAPDNVELLALKSGERATLDHAYRLCAQCHFAQAEAWAGGGHGKRLDGWQGRRVVMGCADCHDPHKPSLVPRMPFRAPQIERIRSPLP
jgi:hypothetical protein